MSDLVTKQLSEFPTATSVATGDLIPVEQGGVLKNADASLVGAKTKADVGLPLVDNTADNVKPVSTAQAAAIAAHATRTDNPHQTTKGQVGLPNVTNDAQVKRTEMAAASGVATLGNDGKLLAGQVPDSLVGGLSYRGSWNANTNTPTIPSAATGNKGYYYIVQTGGTTSIDGHNSWAVGDWILSNGTTWDKIDNSDAVVSVNGKTGAVVVNKTDVGLGNVDNTPDTGKPVSTAQQAALDLKVDDIAPFLQPVMLANLQTNFPVRQRFILSSPGAWYNIAALTGSGVVRRIALFTNINGSASSASPRRSFFVRITANGAGTPQIGGTGGMTMEDFGGAALDQNELVYRNREFGISTNRGTVGMSAFTNLPMPFSNGFLVEMMTTRTGGNPEIWADIEYMSGSYDKGWVLKFQRVNISALAGLARAPIFSVVGKEVLYARLHHILSNGPNNLLPLEGDYQFLYDGSSSVGFESTGTEDFYGSSGFFREGLFNNEESGLLTLSNPTDPFAMHAYRNFHAGAMPYAANGLVLSWQNGEAFNAPGGPVDVQANSWHYER